jgi:excisionase family DNA binding protein
MTPGEVAAMLRVNRRTPGLWAAAGLISTERGSPGGHPRFLASEIRAIAGPGSGPFLKASEFAAIARVGLSTVNRWAAEGRLDAIRLPGGHFRIRESTARAALAYQGIPSGTGGQS